MQIQVTDFDNLLRRSRFVFGGDHGRNADDTAVNGQHPCDNLPITTSNDTGRSHGALSLMFDPETDSNTHSYSLTQWAVERNVRVRLDPSNCIGPSPIQCCCVWQA